MTRLSAETECALVLLAQAGDDNAKVELLSLYAPAINAAARAFARLIPNRDDAVAAGVIGVLVAIKDFDPAKCLRLAGIVRNRIQDEMWQLSSTSMGAMTVPRTILARFFRVMSDPRVAGDIAAAREIASEYQIASATVHAVWTSLNNRPLDVEPADKADAVACIEDRILAQIALDAMAPADRAVVSRRCGFDGHRELTIEEVADTLDLTLAAAKLAYARGLASGRLALA